MGAYTPTYTFTDGTTAYGSQVSFEFSAVQSSVNNVVNAQIPPGAAIADSKLAQITTASKVSGAAITGLASLPSGAGVIPAANLPIGAAATQAQMEAVTDNTVAATPLSMKWHPGVAKAGVQFNGTGTVAINRSFNVTSITDDGTGAYTVNLTTNTSDAFSMVAGFAGGSGISSTAVFSRTSTNPIAAGTVKIDTLQSSGAQVDPAQVSILIFGDFA